MKTVMTILFSLIAVVAAAQVEEQSDIDRYIEEIRSSGMSERGKSEIRFVAAICTGSTILNYQRDETSGRYWPSFTSATCPKPDADTPEIDRWKKLMVSETDKLVLNLKPFVDSDKSGFVTTEEASEFRNLIEFGYLANQVLHEESADLEHLSRASGKNPDEAADMLAEYQSMAKRISGSGISGLPFPELNTSAQGSE